ncbi:MAG: YfhO family protein [Bacilli bacterium]
MKNLTKKDYLNIIVLSVLFLFFVIILSQFKYYYGSTLDWYEQHIAFPEYFRDLFYKTKNLFPDFAFNIGNGQNIYNFSYYGLLSPYILFSYLLPFVNMTNYMIAITILSVIVSAAMLYTWLKNKNNSSLNCFISTFLFIFATSITLHSHRHIMFINYMPFLILGLFGVDRKLEKDRSCTLAISVFLMVMTSYYYSIGGIVALVIYGIYKYLKMHQTITFKRFILDGLYFVAPIILGILLSAVITIPTFQVILSGRGETYNTISLKNILLPNIHLNYFLYEPYGIGLTSFIIMGIISFFDEKKENKFLSIVLGLFLLFPIFNYILNATMYIDSKSLIPMLPICILVISETIKKIFDKKFNYSKVVLIFIIVMLIGLTINSKKIVILSDMAVILIALYLYKKFDKKYLIAIPICLFAFFLSCFVSLTYDDLVIRKEASNEYNKLKDAVDYITDLDDGYYRTNLVYSTQYNNRIFHNLNYFNTTIYSSIYNMNYNYFYYDVMNNNFPHRNRAITSPTNNILYNIFTSSKYTVSDSKKEHQGYELIQSKDDYFIYKNDSVLPIAYATSNILNYDDFAKLGYPKQAEALLNNIIADADTNTDFISNIKKFEINMDEIETEGLTIKEENGHYIIKSKEHGIAKYTLDEKYQNHVIFIRFRNNKSQSCTFGDTYITINEVKNKLTCAEWKYHNQNYDFDYVISDKNLKTLSIIFGKGRYNISDIELYALDYAYLENVITKVDELKITKMLDNVLEGSIDVSKDGYFTTSIPYDKGFTAYIDEEEVKIEKVNESFIGFKISSGKHNIKIIYAAPLKKLSIYISLVGVIIFIIVYFLELRRKL